MEEDKTTKQECMDLQVITKKEIIFPVEINEEAIVALEKNLAPELIPEDLTVKKNYELVVDRIRQGRESKGAIAKHVKLLKEETIAYNKKVNGMGRSLTTRVVGAVTLWKETKTTFDTAAEIAKREKERIETERKEKIWDRIAEIGALVSGNIQSDSIVLTEVISDLNEPVGWADEFAEKARAAIKEAEDKLNNLLNMRIQADEAEKIIAKAEEERKKKEESDKIEQARLTKENERVAAKLKTDQDALGEKKLEEQRKMDAAAAKLKADQDRFEEEKQAEIDRQEEVKRKEEEVKAEAERLARVREQKIKDQAIKEEADKKAAVLAEQNLDQAVTGTIHSLSLFFSEHDFDPAEFDSFVQNIRDGHFEHLVWVD